MKTDRTLYDYVLLYLYQTYTTVPSQVREKLEAKRTMRTRIKDQSKAEWFRFCDFCSQTGLSLFLSCSPLLCLFTPGQRKSKLPQAFARNSRRRCSQQLWHVLLSVDKSSQPSKQNLAFYFCNSASGFTAGASKKRKEAYFVAVLLLRFTFFFFRHKHILNIRIT